MIAYINVYEINVTEPGGAAHGDGAPSRKCHFGNATFATGKAFPERPGSRLHRFARAAGAPSSSISSSAKRRTELRGTLERIGNAGRRTSSPTAETY